LRFNFDPNNGFERAVTQVCQPLFTHQLKLNKVNAENVPGPVSSEGPELGVASACSSSSDILMTRALRFAPKALILQNAVWWLGATD
jgi:hypothetical protein